MAGSHEVRGSIPLGSTTDPRGARRRRRAPLFCFLAHRPIGWKARLIQGGAGAGRRPFLVRPDSPAPFKRPGANARPRRPWASRGRGARLRRARGGRAGPVRAHRGDPRQGGDAFGAWPPWPRRARRGRSARGKQPPEGGAKAVDGIGADSDSAAAGSRTPASAACRRHSTSGGPSPAGRPARRRRHRARQRGPEEGARLSAGVRRPRPAPPRARPTRPAAPDL